MMSVRKYIIIGESRLEIVFEDGVAKSSRPAGSLLDVARHLGQAGKPVPFLTGLGMDPAGDIISDVLVASGVDLSCADRFRGLTSVSTLIEGRLSRYDMVSDNEGFDVSWPRIEKEDVVVFGGFMAVDVGIRDRLWSLLTYAAERKATIVYIPDFDDQRLLQPTKVMPVVFENLELADKVITCPGDISCLFGAENPEIAYRNHLSFYCNDVSIITRSLEGFISLPFGNMPKSRLSNHVSDVIADILMTI